MVEWPQAGVQGLCRRSKWVGNGKESALFWPDGAECPHRGSREGRREKVKKLQDPRGDSDPGEPG